MQVCQQLLYRGTLVVLERLSIKKILGILKWILFIWVVYIYEIDFHRLFDGILKVVYFLSGVLHGKVTDFQEKNVNYNCTSSNVIEQRDRSRNHPR